MQYKSRQQNLCRGIWCWPNPPRVSAEGLGVCTHPSCPPTAPAWQGPGVSSHPLVSCPAVSPLESPAGVCSQGPLLASLAPSSRTRSGHHPPLGGHLLLLAGTWPGGAGKQCAQPHVCPPQDPASAWPLVRHRKPALSLLKERGGPVPGPHTG